MALMTTNRLTRTYSKWDLCTQYRETDFHFLSRLMEHEGIFYFFEHADGKNTMVFGDSPQAFQACPEQSSYNYAPEIGPGDNDWIGDWGAAHQLRTGSYRLWDWHIENANRFESSSQTAKAVAGQHELQNFGFPRRSHAAIQCGSKRLGSPSRRHDDGETADGGNRNRKSALPGSGIHPRSEFRPKIHRRRARLSPVTTSSFQPSTAECNTRPMSTATPTPR